MEVAVVPGRTRTLVERFEQREKLNSSADPASDSTPPVVSETDGTPAIMVSLSVSFLSISVFA